MSSHEFWESLKSTLLYLFLDRSSLFAEYDWEIWGNFYEVIKEEETCPELSLFRVPKVVPTVNWL